MPLLPIILAGGSGTRLWPLSRKNHPKQFLCLQGQESLLQQTMKRVESLSDVEQALVVCNEGHYFLCQEQLAKAHLPLSYLLEPCPKNTAPAIACSAHYALNTLGEDTLLLILPSDHWIGDQQIWQDAMQKGVRLACESECIITFGIQPDSANTAYGYIEAGALFSDEAYQVTRFCEKPSRERAEEMLNQGNFYWNSGMFLCKPSVYLAELQRFAPDIAELSQQAWTHASQHHDFIRLDEALFTQCRSESIDYALMEHTEKALVLPLNLVWSDLGCWNAVAQINSVDEQGNALSGNVIAQESSNCFIRSEHALVTTMGIHNQIIVATPDAVLVADKRYAQEVKNLVESLRLNHSQLTEDHVRVSRPWGYYEILAEGPAFKVKRLMVKPQAKISLQMHQHRAEHWVVVSGEAEVVNDDEVYSLTVNQSTYIPPGTRHRLANKGEAPLFVIEVQSGLYLGEDDIQRFDDIYRRKTTLVE